MVIEDFNDLILDNIGSTYVCISDISDLCTKGNRYILYDITYKLISFDDNSKIYNITDSIGESYNSIGYTIQTSDKILSSIFLLKYVSNINDNIEKILEDISFDNYFISLSERRKEIIAYIKN